MIEKIIQFSFRRPGWIFALVLGTMLWALYSLKNTPLDAIPDLSEPQVIVFTEWMGRSPNLVEDQITYPIVSSMVGAPHVKVVRGYSMFGMSFVYLVFEDETDLYWARSRVLEYLSQIRSKLPEGADPVLGPDASGVGWIFQYSIVDESGKNSIEDLRAFQDWKLRYLLQSIPGVSEVASVGGYVKQYQVQINPNMLAQYGLSLEDVVSKIRASNRDVGGRIVEMSEREYFVRGLGYIKNIKDIEDISLKASGKGDVVLVKHIGNVVEVPDIRRGAVDLNGKGEAVSAIVVMRYGQDVYSLIQKIKDTLVSTTLPEGAKIVITYDRSKIIENSIHTLKTKLWDEMIVVGLVILFFLWHFRSSLIPILILPFAVLFSFIPMYFLGINSNIMSLGGIAIAIGALVDAAIILVENAHKALEHWKEGGEKGDVEDVLLKASQEVGRPIFFALLVMAVSFVPVFVLQGQEGKLFKPLAYTKTFSLFFGAVLAITLAPALIRFLLKLPKPLALANATLTRFCNFFWVGKIENEEQHPVSAKLFKYYTPVLDWVLHHKTKMLWMALILVLMIVPIYKGVPWLGLQNIFPGLKTEFMPSLNEGDILYMPTTVSGISIEKAKEWLQQQNKIIGTFAEVKTVFGKVGRAETATDPAPLSMVETVIQLQPQQDWPKIYHERWYSLWSPAWLKHGLRIFWPEQAPRSWQELVKDLDVAVKLPGTSNAWTFPIRTRIDMLTTGIRTPLGVKIFGDDLDVLESTAKQVEHALQNLSQFKKDTRSVIAERNLGGYYIDIELRRDQLAAYGLTIEEANMLIEGVLGGETVTTTVEKRARYPVNIRYQPLFRSSLEQIKNSPIVTMDGLQLALWQVANVTVSQGPYMIRDENGMLSSWLYIDLHDDVDMADYAKRVDDYFKSSAVLPSGYTYKISGQYELLLRAEKRLWMVGPLTLVIIYLLLYLNTRSFTRTCIIMLAIPFSLIGAFALLAILGYKMSIAVWVGIIALAGVDAETGAVMLLYLDLAYKKMKDQGNMQGLPDLYKAIHDGAVKRIRPKMMTVMTMFVGLLPIMWASPFESGADVTKRIAAPMVGGIFSSFLMELLVYPCLFLVWKLHPKKFEKWTLFIFSGVAVLIFSKAFIVWMYH